MTDQSIDLVWRKSSYSNSNSNCVEVATAGTSVAVRDSKDPDGLVLAFGAGEWRAFVAGITTGSFNPS